MPAKHEHIITCKLSKRQRQLYDEYMARAETRAVMSGGNFMGVINVLMQLRKVGAILALAKRNPRCNVLMQLRKVAATLALGIFTP